MNRRALTQTCVLAVYCTAWSGLALGGYGFAQAPSPQAQDQAQPPTATLPQAPSAQPQPAAPTQPTLQPRPPQTPEEKEAARIAALGSVNGRPYDQPSHKDQFYDYLRDSYGWPALARTTARALYSEARGKPEAWGQDFYPGFMQRMGSNAAITAINGNVRFGMETLFNEDMKYIPCHGCSKKRKIMNALLSEVTARHDVDGHRFFTLTPVLSDFSGPIIANAFWYPNHDPIDGVIGARTVAATRVGQHLFTEFVWERRHKDKKIEDTDSLRKPGPQPNTQPNAPPATPAGTPPTKP
jgi:hypothetical protein